MRSDAPPPLVDIAGVSKAFGGVQALTDITLAVAPGEVHALCGENGAGKSTLIKVLSGSCVPDAGEVHVSGARLQSGSVAASEAAGIAVIHQEPVVFPHLCVDDNLFVGREPRRCAGMLLDRRRMRAETQAVLSRLGQEIDPRVPVGDLSVAQRQMVAIARALSRSCRLLIMDEPTASLSARESEVLFAIIRQLRAEGVSVLYVSHRLEEVFALADRVTVLRDGRLVGTCPIGEVDREGLIRMMVGRRIEETTDHGPQTTDPGPGTRDPRPKTQDPGPVTTDHRPQTTDRGPKTRDPRPVTQEGDAGAAGGAPVRSISSVPPSPPLPSSQGSTTPPPHHPTTLQVSGLARAGAFRGVSFEVRAGEIVGLAGLVGAGRSEVARAIFGVDRPDAGSVSVEGKVLQAGSVAEAIRAGIALVPEDRQHMGLVLPMAIGANLTMAILNSVSRLGFPSSRLETPVIERLMRQLDIRAAGPGAAAETLSGGNQQKVVLGKWLAASPKVLILDEPTRGVDVGAKAEVHRLVRELAAAAAAVLVISSELPEILGLCDRILVMRAGEVVGELPRAGATQEGILALAIGQAGAGTAAAGEVAR